MLIIPKGGLCNYLRVIISYYEYARTIDEELIVVWEVSESCPGFFLDYFEPISNITFLTEKPSDDMKVEYIGCSPHPNFKGNYRSKFGGWCNLIPKHSIKKKIEEKRNILKDNYISIHVRRTDHVGLAKKNNRFISDEEFFNFIDESYNYKNIYLATDDKDTYYKFKKKYPDQILFKYHKTRNEDCLRQTSLEDAIIDIYICSFSKYFKGSGWSSFSDVIQIIRDSRI